MACSQVLPTAAWLRRKLAVGLMDGSLRTTSTSLAKRPMRRRGGDCQRRPASSGDWPTRTREVEVTSGGTSRWGFTETGFAGLDEPRQEISSATATIAQKCRG